MRRPGAALALAAALAIVAAWATPQSGRSRDPAPAADAIEPAPARVEPPPASPAPTGASSAAPASAAADAEPLTLYLDQRGAIRVDDRVLDREELLRRLVAYADGSRDESDRWWPSNRPALLVVDSAARWWPVRNALKLVTHGDVRVPDVRLRVDGRTRRLDLRGVFCRAKVKVEIPPRVEVTLRPSAEGAAVTLLGKDLGTGEGVFASLEASLAEIRNAHPEIGALVDAEPDVEIGDFVRMLDAMERAGYDPPRVAGVPPDCPQGWAIEDVRVIVQTCAGEERLRALEKIARSPEDDDQWAAYDALADLGEEAIPVCVRGLRDGVRPNCLPSSPGLHPLEALATIVAETGADPRPFWPDVLAALRKLRDPCDCSERASAKRIARALGPSAREDLDRVFRELGRRPIRWDDEGDAR